MGDKCPGSQQYIKFSISKKAKKYKKNITEHIDS